MKIDWTKQPTPEHCWLEGIYLKNESGWYVLNGSSWMHETKGAWLAHREGEYFTVHRKPEEYMPKVGGYCDWMIGDIHRTGHYVGINSQGSYVVEYDGEYRSYHGSQIKFRPPKTEEELFVDAAVDTMNKSIDDSQVGWATAMYQAGFKAPN